MAQFEQHFVQDLTQQIKVRHCGSIVFNADNESNVVSVRLFNGSEPVAISGSVVGAVVCSDGSTVPLTGSYSGNTASITLTGDCFAVLGQIGVGIQIVNGTQKTTVLKVIYNVETLTTENVVDPGSRITLEVGDLIAAIDEAVATIPEDYSALTSEVEDIKAVNKIFNRDVVGVPNPIDTATWIDNANLNDSGAVKAAQGWKVTQGYIETSADSYKISYNNSETSYIVQVAGYTSNGSFVRMFANADSSSGVRSFTIDTTSVDKIRIATRYGNPILSVYPNDGKIVEKLASVEDDVSDLKSAYDNLISLEPFTTRNVEGNVDEQNSKAVLTWSAAWRRTSFSVTQGELYNIQINTYNYGTQIVYVYVCESDDTIIDRYTNNSVNVMHTETISIKIPANATKVYVRSFYNSSVSTLPLVYKVITAKHESEQALEWLGTYNTRKSVPIDVTAGNFENYTVGQKFIYGTGANWNIASFTPKDGASYVARVSTLNYNQAISYVLLCDENDEIVEVKNNSVTGPASIEEIPFTVGNSVKKAYVRCNYAVNNALEVYETSATVENMVGNAISTKPYVYVACSDAPETQKSSADVVLPGTNDELVLQSIINTVCHNGGGKIKLSRGTVFIDSFPNKETNLDDYVALLIPQATPCTVVIEGDVLGMASGGTAFLITSDCYADLDSTKQYTVIRGGHITYPFGSKLSFRMHDIRIDLPWNQKPIRCIDCLYFNQVLIERVTMSAFKNGYGDGWNVDLRTPPAVAVDGCEGLRATGGSNYGILDDYRNVFATGFYKGFRLAGEHLVGINLSAIFNVYGYTFGDYAYAGGSIHPITLINCCDERNVNLPLFVMNGDTGHGAGKQAITFVDFNVERIAEYTPGGELGNYAVEQTPGIFRGEIQYTIQDEFGGHGNTVSLPFWAAGSGRGIKSRNQAQLQACDTTTRLTYAPNYMQKIYDTTLNKLLIYNGSAWVDTNGSTVD